MNPRPGNEWLRSAKKKFWAREKKSNFAGQIGSARGGYGRETERGREGVEGREERNERRERRTEGLWDEGEEREEGTEGVGEKKEKRKDTQEIEFYIQTKIPGKRVALIIDVKTKIPANRVFFIVDIITKQKKTRGLDCFSIKLYDFYMNPTFAS